MKMQWAALNGIMDNGINRLMGSNLPYLISPKLSFPTLCRFCQNQSVIGISFSRSQSDPIKRRPLYFLSQGFEIASSSGHGIFLSSCPVGKTVLGCHMEPSVTNRIEKWRYFFPTDGGQSCQCYDYWGARSYLISSPTRQKLNSTQIKNLFIDKNCCFEESNFAPSFKIC